MQRGKKRLYQLTPVMVLAGSFLLLIIVGTLVLKIPSSVEQEITWVDALFTATSATTVTGLSVFDPGSTLTTFGETVLMVLIQFGGIGLMTFAVGIFILLRRKVGLKNRLYLQESFGQSRTGGLVKLVKHICLFVFTIEALAVMILSLHWYPEYGARGIYYSVFHAISAFNNAGFALFPDNLMRFVGDPIVNLVLSGLLIIGGLGFVVVMELIKKHRFSQWSLHTKLMVVGTITINIVATLVIFLLEYQNPGTLKDLTWSDKLWASYFQAVTPRTAGFNTINTGAMEEPTLFFTMLLMFIGGGSASTASGIKLTTFIIVLVATISFIRGIQEPNLFGRRIKTAIIVRSLAISTVSLLLIFFFLFILTITEKAPFLPLAFEVVSAFGTVGLSTGITAELTDAGKLILCVVMFLGRIGPLTLFYLLLKPKRETYLYPYEQVQTG